MEVKTVSLTGFVSAGPSVLGLSQLTNSMGGGVTTALFGQDFSKGNTGTFMDESDNQNSF
jgi:hypothetical protein